uniref:Uncharacterized protein n=1 Tax=Anopheles stephensi TaxID=30069 RepID=A0A182XYW7_ANOST
MSSARCLNWSRPPPGRHPAALRKQLSCVEPSAPSPLPGGGRSQSVTTSTSTSPAGDTDFRHFLVTGAIIHSNRLQTYHTYNQAHRGASASLLRSRPASHTVGEDGHEQRRRPSSASAGGLLSTADDRTGVRAGRRAILCKQLSLDRSILVASSIASGMATVAAGGTIPLGVSADRDEMGDGWAFSRKQQQQQQQQRAGAGTRNDADVNAKKGLKSSKDSRINIKIFLGQTVQQDSSDTGISDTEGPTTTSAAALQQGTNTSRPIASHSKQDPSSSTNMSSDAATAGGKGKPTNGTTSNNGAPNSSPAVAGTSHPAANTGNGPGASGRTSSLAQRRAQFQANRQNSEAHDRRHPPLVRAMSAPIRPADTDACKLLQGKKKPRRRKVLREKDEYNICEEDEFSDDGCGKLAGPGAGGTQTMGSNGRQVPACILPMRSRSVLGGPCDIETLVSLLSSGGSDSEKEQDSTQASSASTGQQSPTGAVAPQPNAFHRGQPFSSAHLAKGRAPMLKKAGKSVSFQESDLKPVATAGLNRDYRKPSFQPTVASRIRRTQQLVSTLNAFQLGKDKDRSEDKDKESGDHTASVEQLTEHNSCTTNETPTIPSTTVAGTKGEANKTPAGAVSVSTSGDLQTPKEQECYRLFLKMSKKGLAVSYDTILRGMLTPTELRVLQKKKSRQRNESESTENGTGGDSSPENGLFDNGATFEEFRFHPSNEDVPLTIPEEPPTVANEDSNGCEQERSEIATESAYLNEGP